MKTSHTQRALDDVEDALRRLEWRVSNPNKNAKEDAPFILEDGLSALSIARSALDRKRIGKG